MYQIIYSSQKLETTLCPYPVMTFDFYTSKVAALHTL